MKRARISAAAVVAAWMSLAAALDLDAVAVAQETAARGGGCRSVWVTAPAFGKPVSRLRKPLTFSAEEVLDLEFQVSIPADASSAGQGLELKLFTPKGHLYQTLAVPTQPQSAGTAPAPKRRARFRTVTARLPVAGTTIVNNSLYGTWKAEAYVAGERTACAKARSFVIQP